MELRPSQAEVLSKTWTAINQGAKAPLITAPTGWGKTVLLAHIAKQAGSALIIAHRRELIQQTLETLARCGMTTGDAIRVESVQKVVRRMERETWRPCAIIVDEAHHAVGGTTWGRVIAHYDPKLLIGVTATPERLDGRGLGSAAGGFFDALIKGPGIEELVDDGTLSRPVVYAPPGPDLKGLRSRAGDYQRGDIEFAMSKARITGDAVEHYKRHADREPALVFCATVAHAESVAAGFAAAGYRAASLDGRMASDVRRDRIESLGDGRLDVLTTCDIVSEGTDIPVVSVAILLRPTKSLGLYLQQVGRALRRHPGKTKTVILDHVGNCHRHGLPDDPRGWRLDSEPRSKRKSSEIRIRQCAKCYYVHKPAPQCPACGYEYPVKQRKIQTVEGELSEIARQGELFPGRDRDPNKGREIAYLRKIAMQRGYHPRWAEHVYASRMRKKARKRNESV